MGAFTELAGKTFGRLTVRCQAGKSRANRYQWLCDCKCGNTVTALGSMLKIGNIRSCGCLRRETTSKTGLTSVVDLTGKRYHMLVVLRRNALNIRRSAAWDCKCDCGRETTVASTDLKEKMVRSCGCMRALSLIGRVYGRLTVIDRASEPRSGKVLWLCRCACGITASVVSGDLQNGDTRSCGCLKRELAIDLTGLSFGRVIVLSRAASNSEGMALWLCRCSCGTEKVLEGKSLRRGTVISCGCAKGHQGPAERPDTISQGASARAHVRRTRITKAGGSHTAQEMRDLYTAQEGRCAEPSCRKSVPNRSDYHAHHKVPVAKGGTSDISNFEILCIPCHKKLKGA